MNILNKKQARITSFSLMLIALFTIFPLKLFSFFFPMILIFTVIKALTPIVEKYITDTKGRVFSVITISIITATIFSLLFIYLTVALIKGIQDISSLVGYSQDLVYKIYDFMDGILPNGLNFTKKETFSVILNWVTENSELFKKVGENTLHIFVHVILGLVIGMLIALIHNKKLSPHLLLKKECLHRLENLTKSFSDVVFAQVKISAINTVLTFIYLAVILPLLGINLPYMKTLIILTFIFGLIPIIGNIISNTIICVSSFAVSPAVLVGSLIFLILIHKAEYFLNAKIIGGHINASAWELLIVMIVFQSMFGIAGMIAAPIYYAYLKKELRLFRLI